MQLWLSPHQIVPSPTVSDHALESGLSWGRAFQHHSQILIHCFLYPPQSAQETSKSQDEALQVREDSEIFPKTSCSPYQKYLEIKQKKKTTPGLFIQLNNISLGGWCVCNRHNKG